MVSEAIDRNAARAFRAKDKSEYQRCVMKAKKDGSIAFVVKSLLQFKRNHIEY